MSIPPMPYNIRFLKDSVVVYWIFHIMRQTLIVRNNHIIIIIIHFLSSNFFLCVIFLYRNKFVNIICFCVPHDFFSGQKSDAIYLVVLTLGVVV